MPNLNTSFYVLSENKAQDLLGFICQLTQTALNKSSQSILILIEDEALLMQLDDALWAHDATSFIPHQLLSSPNPTPPSAPEAQDHFDSALAPVLLASSFPNEFSGLVINTTAHPVTEFLNPTTTIHLTRILEIIKPDPRSVQVGRLKYKAYRQLGYELTHFKI